MKDLLRLAILVPLTLLTLAGCENRGGGVALPDRIALPNGFQPEGIAARGPFLYVGSIPTGAVYRADFLTGSGSILVPAQQGRAAIGLKIDERDRLFVAGGSTGQAFVYDAALGSSLASYTLSQANPVFVNDVVLTSDAAWFTDSRNPALYRVAIPADGTLGGQEAVSSLPLSGDFVFQAGVNNLNGISAFSGTTLIVVQSGTGLLFTVDTATGLTRKIDLGVETVVNGDGILLEGLKLFVVQNRLNLVAVVELAPELATGLVRTRVSNAVFDLPTTLAAAGGSLYAVNARFGIQATADTPYNVVRFDRP